MQNEISLAKVFVMLNNYLPVSDSSTINLSPHFFIINDFIASIWLCNAIQKNYRQITIEEAITMMEKETGYIIFDVRAAQEYRKKNIPGAINIVKEFHWH